MNCHSDKTSIIKPQLLFIFLVRKSSGGEGEGRKEGNGMAGKKKITNFPRESFRQDSAGLQSFEIHGENMGKYLKL